MSYTEQSERIRQGWEARRGVPLVYADVKPPVFAGHPRFAREFSYRIATFVLRVFHNRETEFYEEANRAIVKNSRFYIENTDVRDDRDSFYWNISELCRAMLRYDSLGTDEAGLISPEAEAAFLEMALGYCRDMSRLADAECAHDATWRIYESENHHVQRDSALWQFCLILIRHGMGGELLGDGADVQTHFDAWSEFYRRWLRERAAKSMFVEVQSKCYGTHTLKNIFPLLDFSPDPALRREAESFITLFWVLWGQEQLGGRQGGGQTRVYPGSAVVTDSETAHWAWYYTGVGSFARPGGMDYVLLDCSYRMPPVVERLILSNEARGVYTVESRPFGRASADNRYPDYRFDTNWGHIYRYSYCTPRFILGTLMCPQLTERDWCGISSQNRFQGMTFADRNALILPLPQPVGMHNLQSTEPTIAYNAFWSEMCEGTLLTQRCRDYKGGMRVWFSAGGGVADNVTEKDGWIFTECGGAYAAVRAARGGYSWADAASGRITGRWLVCEDANSPVILEAADVSRFPDRASFEEAVLALSPVWDGGTLRYRSLYGHDFVFVADADGDSTVDGEYYVRQIPYSFRSPFVNCPWDGSAVRVTFGGDELTLNFSYGENRT